MSAKGVLKTPNHEINGDWLFRRTCLKYISADVDGYGCKLQIPLYLLWNLDNLLECCMKNE